MNNKGFAISGILYSILIIFVASISIMLYNLQNKKTILDQIKTDTVKAVNFETSIDYLTEKINNLEEIISQCNSDGITVRYNEETDYVQLYSEGEWIDWKRAYLKSLVIFEEGYFTEGFSLGSSVAYNSYFNNKGSFSYTKGSPLSGTLSSTVTSIGNFLNVSIDMTNYTTVNVEVLNSSGISKISSCDISGLNGSYYVAIAYIIGSQTIYDEVTIDIVSTPGTYISSNRITTNASNNGSVNYGSTGTKYITRIWLE